MLTIFTTPRPFKGHNEVAFRNAIRSWRLLIPTPDIIVLGGSGTWAKTEGARYLHGYRRNDRDLPYLDDFVAKAQELARYDILCLTSDHLVFFQDLMDTLYVIDEQFPGPFLLVGRRWNVDQYWPIDFDADWQTLLLDKMAAIGEFRGSASKDYMIFRRPLVMDPPPFLIGRPWYDSWFVWAAKRDGVPVIDGSLSITAVHANHSFPHIPGAPPGEDYGHGILRRAKDRDSLYNKKLAGKVGVAHGAGHTKHADWVMMPDFRLVERRV